MGRQDATMLGRPVVRVWGTGQRMQDQFIETSPKLICGPQANSALEFGATEGTHTIVPLLQGCMVCWAIVLMCLYRHKPAVRFTHSGKAPMRRAISPDTLSGPGQVLPSSRRSS